MHASSPLGGGSSSRILLRPGPLRVHDARTGRTPFFSKAFARRLERRVTERAVGSPSVHHVRTGRFRIARPRDRARHVCARSAWRRFDPLVFSYGQSRAARMTSGLDFALFSLESEQNMLCATLHGPLGAVRPFRAQLRPGPPCVHDVRAGRDPLVYSYGQGRSASRRPV